LNARLGYAAATGIVLAVEVFIALFVRDGFVRPYVGDVLAVILVYLALRTATSLRVAPAAAAALGIAFAVELGQLVNLLDMLGLRGNRVARVILGSGFDPADLLAYAAGALCAVLVERARTGVAFRALRR
jgi:hypothetical protein